MSKRNFETIVEGAFYRMANGEVAGPAKPNTGGNEIYPWEVGHRTYTEDGYYHHDKRDHCYNLIASVNPDGTPWVEPVEQSNAATEPEKRLPQPGEKWLTRGGFVASIEKVCERPGRGRYLWGVVMLDGGPFRVAWYLAGEVYLHKRDPNDLVEYIGPVKPQASDQSAIESEQDQSNQGDCFDLAIGAFYSLDDLAPHVGEFDYDGSQLSATMLDGRDAWFSRVNRIVWQCIGIGECEEPAPSVKQVLESVDAELFNKALAGERGEDQQRIANEVAKLGAMLLRKNADYGSSAWKRPVLAPHIKPGDSILVRMSDKIERILSLATKPPEVVEEKLEETIDDFVGYWILAKAAPGRAK